jgi:hypothetical protein
LKIEWNWPRKQGLGFLFLSAFFFLMFWHIATAPNPKTGGIRSESTLFLVVFGAIYVVPTLIIGLSNLLNQTSIVATRESLFMRTSPIPLKKVVSVSGQRLQQFFVRSMPGKAAYRSVYVMDGDSHCLRLASRMPSEFAAHQICHELQDFYGLEDLPVFGQNTLPYQPGPRSR